MEGEVISSRIKPTESTTLAKLNVFDQIKLLISKLNNDAVSELNAAEKLSASELKMTASLEKLFNTAIEEMQKGEHTSVTIQVSSKYIPYLDRVIDERHGLGRFYTFDVRKKDLPLNVKYMFMVKISKRVTEEVYKR